MRKQGRISAGQVERGRCLKASGDKFSLIDAGSVCLTACGAFPFIFLSKPAQQGSTEAADPADAHASNRCMPPFCPQP